MTRKRVLLAVVLILIAAGAFVGWRILSKGSLRTMRKWTVTSIR